MAVKSIEKAQEKQKEEYDKNCSKKKFEKGELVLVYDSRHKKRSQHKFLPRWHGPKRIMEAHHDNGTYELEELNRESYGWVNQDKLKLFHAR